MDQTPPTTPRQYEFIFDAAVRVCVTTKTIRRWIGKMLSEIGSHNDHASTTTRSAR